MIKGIYILILVFLLCNNLVFCQQGKIELKTTNDTLDNEKLKEIDPLSPAKAAFYSGIIPGLGQAYNKKYWKIPLVYGALGSAIYFYVTNNAKYQEFRDAYKNRLEGRTNDNLYFLDQDRLIAGQKFYQRNRDLSTFFIIGFYILNIVDANIDAHLLQFNVNDKLSLKPDILNNDLSNQKNLGFKFCYRL